MNNKQAFAEIIQSSLSEWTAQCWSWDTPATFGSLVACSNGTTQTFGIVHKIQTGSMDPARHPIAYQKTEEELLKEQPQIFEFLQTTFTCITIGYQEQDKLFYHLPEVPPKIHAFVKNASNQECKTFFEQTDFLHLLFNSSHLISNLDELILATLKQLQKKNLLQKNDLQNFIETFAMINKNDYQKLKTFLQRTNQLLSL